MILDRRQLLRALPAAAPALSAAAAEPPKTRLYIFEQYFLENGTQPARIQEFFSKALVPALERVHKGPKLFLEAVVAPHMPQAAAVIGLESFDQVFSISKALFADADFTRAFDRWESGEPPYLHSSATLIEAADYSPEIAPAKPDAAPRLFEMRVYHSPTARQWKLLHDRFRGAEIEIFHRSGVHPVLYGSTLFGPLRPNLTYFIPFESLAAREKAWAKFSADPEWVKVRKESIDKGGQISAVQQMSIYRATAYSPVR